MFVLLSILALLLLIVFKTGEASKVIGNLIKQLALLFQQVHFHPASHHIVALLMYVFLGRGFSLQRVEEVSLLVGRELVDNLFRHPQTLLFHCFLRPSHLGVLKEWVIHEQT